MSEHIARGEGITISGFGAFNVRLTPERTARNPRTMEKVVIPERSRVVFRTSPKLLDRINTYHTERELQN